MLVFFASGSKSIASETVAAMTSAGASVTAYQHCLVGHPATVSFTLSTLPLTARGSVSLVSTLEAKASGPSMGVGGASIIGQL